MFVNPTFEAFCPVTQFFLMEYMKMCLDSTNKVEQW